MSPAPGYNPQPRRPRWGVVLPGRTELSRELPIGVVPPPAVAVIALSHRGVAPAEPMVRVGQGVRVGEPIAAGKLPGDPWIHASIAGRITAIGPGRVCGVAGPVPCVTITSDGSDDRWDGYTPQPDTATLTPDALRERIARAGIMGLGGALFPTARKLMAGHPRAHTLIINGAECEPYISCDERLLRERTEQVLAGSRILLQASGAGRCVLVLKSDMTAARVAAWNALHANSDERFGLSVVTHVYPAGGERQLVEMVLGREVPSEGHPTDIGCIVHNVATAAAVADFFLAGQPLISRVVTVSGGAVSRPRNVEARLGTPAAELIRQAGGYRGEAARLIMGGPMMGIALPDDGLPITAATNCLIAATAEELRLAAAGELPCIRCGACVEVCPARLMPLELWLAARHEDAHALEELGVNDCIECGACDYSCPSHIPLVTHIIAGKSVLAAHRLARARAETARRRHEDRQVRLARDAAERARELEDQLPPDTAGAGARAVLDVLLDRTRRRGRDD